MADLHTLELINSDGTPLDGRIARVLVRLRPRLSRQFPSLDDEVIVTEVLEEAGRRITHRERSSGPIKKIYGFAWVTLRNVAVSRCCTGRSRLAIREVRDENILRTVEAQEGTPERIERDILVRQVLEMLSEEERYVCLAKKAGFSAEEIAQYSGRTAASVDTLFSRAKQKLRSLLSTPPAKSTHRGAPLRHLNGHASIPQSSAPYLAGASDGTGQSLSGRRRRVRGRHRRGIQPRQPESGAYRLPPT